MVYVDRGQVEQVLLNLLLNARDAMPYGGRVTVHTANVVLGQEHALRHGPTKVVAGRYAMLSVSDSGIGMERETMERVFEPFFTTKPVGQGTGLGLASVYGIVKQNNGYVWAYSEPGEGTVFKIYLPVAAGEAKREPGASTETHRDAATETVLVVDDDVVVRQFTCDLLRGQGYVCLLAGTTGEAMEIVERHPGPIHLAIVDVVLPRMSGRELVERLTSLRPDLPVLYMSGYASDEIVRRGLLRPGVPFLEKPYHPDALLRLVREVLKGR